jgi:hypothetical protein
MSIRLQVFCLECLGDSWCLLPDSPEAHHEVAALG